MNTSIMYSEMCKKVSKLLNNCKGTTLEVGKQNSMFVYISPLMYFLKVHWTGWLSSLTSWIKLIVWRQGNDFSESRVLAVK